MELRINEGRKTLICYYNPYSNVILTLIDTISVFLETLFPGICCFKTIAKTYYNSVRPLCQCSKVMKF